MLPGIGRGPRVALTWLLLGSSPCAQSQTETTFTYQGELKQAGQPKVGTVDLRFDAYAGADGGSPLNAQPVILDGVPLRDGVFAVQIDFGSTLFSGASVFLQVGVREDAIGDAADSTDFTALLPRQPATATPYALHARGVATDAVGGAQIADGGASGVDIADGSLSAADLGDASVASVEIADGSVSGVDIADGAITAAKADTTTAGSGLQRRLASACGVGEAIADIASSGAPTCVPALAAVTAAADSGLNATSAGASTALTVNASAFQRRVTGRCPYRRAAVVAVTEYGAVDCAYFDTPSPLSVVTLDSLSDVGAHVSALHGSILNEVGVAYYDTSSGGRLRFLRCPNETCSPLPTPITLDDPANDVGQFVSLALGANFAPAIAYYDATAGDLKFASCSNADCTGAVTIRVIDSDGDVGRHAEIVRGFSSFGIAYYDASNSRYKFAQCSDASCSAPTLTPLTGLAAAAAASDIAVARDGFAQPPEFAVTVDTGRLLLVRCADNACAGFTSHVVMSNNASRPISMASIFQFNGTQQRWLSFRHANPSASPLKFCNTRDCDFGGASVFGDTLNGTPVANALVARSQGLPLLVQSDSTAQLGVRSMLDALTTASSRLSGSVGGGAMDAWAFPQALPDGSASIPPGIGGIGIVYQAGGDLLYLRCTRDDCSERWP